MEHMVRVQPLECAFALEAPERNRDWYEKRGYEPASTALFRTASTGADVVLDIGAHVGYFSLVAAHAAPAATVVAVEASPDNATVLRRNVEHVGVRVVNAAFGSTRGTVTVQLTEASDNSGIGGHPNSPTERTVEVPAVRGEDLDVPGGGRVVVKLDVEGYELAALTGLESVFARFDDVRLLVEMNPKCLALAGSGPDELIDRLHGYDLRVFVIDEDARAWHELHRGDDWRPLVDALGYANLYCVTAERCRTVSAVLHSGGIGGAERSHAEMVESLVRQGCMVHSVVPEPDLGLGGELRGLGSSVSVVPPLAWWDLWPAEHAEQPDAWTRRVLVHEPLIRAIQDVGADLVLTQSGVVPQGAVAAAAVRRPHLWYLREFGDLDHGLVLPGGPAGFGDAVRALSSEVVTNSAAVRDHLLGEHDNIRVLHPAPQLPDATPHRSSVVADTRPWTLGVVASLNPGKGQVDAVDAVALLRAEGVDVPVVLVGPGSEEDRDRLVARATQAGVGDLVELTGPLADRADVYARFDAVAVTSRAEAFGRVPFEAAAAGLPVIYPAFGGPAEYLVDGVTGLSYVPGDVPALADAIRGLRDDRTRAAALASAAKASLLDATARERYDTAVLAVVHEVADRGEPDVVRDVLGSVAREALGHAAEARLRRDEVTQIRGDLTRVVAEHEELVARFRELEADHAALIEGHHGVVAAWDDARADLVRSREANAELRTRLGDARDEASAAANEVEGLRRRVTELETEHALVVESRTWRYSRRAAGFLRGSRHG